MTEDTKDPAVIAKSLKPRQRSGLLSRPGSGAMTGHTLDHLVKMGLMRWSDYYPTELGYAVRKELGARDR